MAVETGFVIEGDDEDNSLRAKTVKANGETQIYNILYGHGGNDTLIGNDGMRDADVEKAGVQLFGEDGNDTLRGTGGADTLSGGIGDDNITYDDGADLIDGGEGQDTLAIYTPYVNVDFDSLKPMGIEILATGGAVIRFGAWDVNSFTQITGGGKLVFSLQTTLDGSNLVGAFDLSGSGFDDRFDLTDSSKAFDARGGAGNDTIQAGSGAVRFWGDDGNDILVGGASYDLLRGNDGNDLLAGGGTSGDTFDGGSGNDTVTGGDGKDVVSAGKGDDAIDTAGGNDSILVGTGNDVVHAGDGNDRISGAKAQFGPAGAAATDDKTLDGGAGDDIFGGFKFSAMSKTHILGGDGKDTVAIGGDISNLVIKDVEVLQIASDKIIADADTLDSFDRFTGIKDAQLTIQLSSGGQFTWDAASDKQNSATMIGSKDADQIDLSAATQLWTINGGGGNDSIVGPSDRRFIESIDGGAGNDTLTGGKFLDALYGGDGNDVFIATKGNDGLYGQGGRDTFVFSDKIDRTTIANYDNSGKDRDIIDLSHVNSIKDFDDMIDHHIKMQFGGQWLTIQIGKGEIYLYDVEASDLDKSAFIF